MEINQFKGLTDITHQNSGYYLMRVKDKMYETKKESILSDVGVILLNHIDEHYQ